MESIRFHVWNALGWASMQLGAAMHAAGLRLCGLAGWLDATADGYRP